MYDPTIEDSYKRHIQLDEQQFMVDILDTAGQDDFSPLRDSWIRESQGFLLIYSVTDRKSLDYLDQILGQIRRTKEDYETLSIPIVLAGNKCDLTDRRQVCAAEAAEWARARGIKIVMEMSAKTRLNIVEAFQTLVKEVAAEHLAAEKGKNKKKNKNKKKMNNACTVL